MLPPPPLSPLLLHASSHLSHNNLLSSASIETVSSLSESEDESLGGRFCLLQASPGNVIGDPDRNPYLHLEMAHARQAVLRARARLAAYKLSEQVLHMRLYHLKVKHVRKELEDANTGVGRIYIEHMANEANEYYVDLQ
ncbi:hypothetical protein SCLCIDRAFT_8488 [Scleroderma citrinum Foug A]|uniref:Uncharacterized protein n=1 Tax=Scleroderma citrinum Foug A TaxID=1036808 RepID=A0A0C2ZIC0_9AGAM|nr:hypothetical protein SCLCIDRAFT_11835 [Scleroderma citrinum Foug A]KIM64378.1 hypothetical protein SCLCIDRAFT_8488 [Scleroderma citrinum Foug A]